MARVSLLRRIAAIVVSTAVALMVVSCSQPNDPAKPDPTKAPVISVSADQDTLSFLINQAITPITVSNSGPAASSYTVTPALPAGLTINATTGVISGTPTAGSAQSSYRVIASNFDGSDTISIVLRIFSPAQGYLYLYADDYVDSLYINGAAQALDTNMRIDLWYRIPIAPISSGKLTLGILGNNSKAWSASVIAAVVLNNNPILKTDETWKCSFSNEPGWGATGFSDAAWLPVSDYGRFDSTGYGSSTPTCTPKTGAVYAGDSCPATQMMTALPRCIWSPKKTFFRKTFTLAQSDTGFILAAANAGRYTAWLNGVQVAADTNPPSAPSISDTVRVVFAAGTNLLAYEVEDTAANENGLGIVFGGGAFAIDTTWATAESTWLWNADTNATHEDSLNPGNWYIQTDTIRKYTVYTRTDTSWRFSAVEEAGWQTTSFVEGQQWKSPASYNMGNKNFRLPLNGDIGTGSRTYPAIDYSVANPEVRWIWSSAKVYFRKEFTLQ